MIHLIQGQHSIHDDNHYIHNKLFGVQAHYQGQQSDGLFFLHPVLDDTNKTIQYYAFDSEEEKKHFLQLTKISGIGHKSAFHICSIPESELETIITNIDIKALTKLPGIGPKTARRIIVELQQNITKKAIKKMHTSANPHAKQLSKYLQNLGYDKTAIQAAIDTYPDKITAANSKEVLSTILQQL